ncbi:hypothetical protein MRX96_014476 [Rhipicephalus microplus]
MRPRSADSEKSKKYDRQLRLWGDHGQVALESSHVCLINATATGTEALKSIVLPGVGAFTIVDGHSVTAEDVGNNFFLDSDSIGKPRAEAAARLLVELNPDVQGDFVEETAENLLEHNPAYFSNFSAVIATGLQEKTLLALAARLWDANVPLLVCRSYGFIGYMRLQMNEHPVVETHPDNDFDDLRLDRPFPALRAFVDSINMAELKDKEHSHTPYVVILLKALDEWQRQNSMQALPKSSQEKQAFKALIKGWIRPKGDQGSEDEENFEEAIKAVNKSLNPTEVPHQVKRLFEEEACLNITAESKPFWILIRALKDFVEAEAAEYDAKDASVDTILTSLDSPDSEIIFYLMLRAADRFYSQYNRYPGFFEDQLETDISKLKASLCQVLEQLGSGPVAKDDYVHEMCRYGAAEIHTVAAFVGGCAAQEIIKLVTGQYVPLNNTFIFNGMTTTSETFVL